MARQARPAITNRGRLPKAFESYRDELRVRRAWCLGKWIAYVEQDIKEKGDDFFRSDEGNRAVDNLLKLELKDMQIEANREDTQVKGNILLEAIARANKDNSLIDITPVDEIEDCAIGSIIEADSAKQAMNGL